MDNLLHMLTGETWEETVCRIILFIFIIETMSGFSMLIGGITSSK